MSNQKEGKTDEGDGIAMSRQEDDEHYENGKDTPPRRSKRTKFREFDDDENEAAPGTSVPANAHIAKKGVKTMSGPIPTIKCPEQSFNSS